MTKSLIQKFSKTVSAILLLAVFSTLVPVSVISVSANNNNQTDCSISVLSNTSDMVDGHNAVPIEFIHPLWTASIPSATWIWSESVVQDFVGTTTKTFSKNFSFNGNINSANLYIAADDYYKIWINNVLVADSGIAQGNSNDMEQDVINVASFIKNGENNLIIEVTNHSVTPFDGITAYNNPAGLMYKLDVNANCNINTPPVITLTEPSPFIAYVGDNITEPGFTATDKEDGDITNKVSIIGNFSSATVGSYTIEYSVVDSGGLSATATRTIVIKEKIVSGVCTELVIDGFQNPSSRITNYNTNIGSIKSYVSMNTGDSIGGELDIVHNSNGNTSYSNIINYTGIGKFFSIDNGAQDNSTVILSWDGTDNDANKINYSGLNNLNLSLNGARDAIKFKYGADFTDNKNIPIKVTVYSDVNNSSFAKVSLYGAPSAILSKEIKFSEFTKDLGNGADFTKVGAIVFEIDLTSRDGHDFVIGNIESVCGTTIAKKYSDLEITKTVNNVTPKQSENIIYTVKVKNLGGDKATNVKAVDNLSSLLDFVSASTTKGVYNNQNATWEIGDMENGATEMLFINAKVKSDVSFATDYLIHNLATVSALEEDTNNLNNSSTVDVEVKLPKCIAPEFTNSSSISSEVNKDFTFTLIASSTTSSTITVATSTLPSGLTFDGVNKISGKPTQTGNFNVPIRVFNSCASQDKVLLIEIKSAPIILPKADLSISKTVNKLNADIADTIIYTIKVLNNGGDNATNVTATDILPNTLNLTSVTTTLGTYATSTGIWTIGNLTNGASTTMTITASVKAGTEGQKIKNLASVVANEQDPNSNNNSSFVEFSVNNPVACLLPQITNSLVASSEVNKDFTFTLIASSTTSSTITVATSTLPSGLTFDGVNKISGKPTQTGNFNVAIKATNSCGFDEKNLLISITPGNTGGGGGGGSTIKADLSISKTVNKLNADIADTIIYTIKVLNNGGDNATNVTATDILPNTLNLTSVTTTLGTYATSTGIWTIGNLTNGASTTMTITASVKAGTEGQKIVNTATVSANESDPNTGNNSSTIETSIKAKDNPPSKTTGKITFCMLYGDKDNVLATSSVGLPAGLFTIKLARSTNFASSTVQTKTWNATSFTPNTKVILASGLDAECITYNDMPFGEYNYSQMEKSSSSWSEPKYNDQFGHPVNDISDFFEFGPANDNADGNIGLYADRTERTVMMYSNYTLAPVCLLPQITNSLVASSEVNKDFTFTLIASSTTSSTITVATSTLPSGLTFDGVNKISGKPTQTGNFNISIKATNGCGFDEKNLLISVTPGNTGGGGGGGSTIKADLSISKTVNKLNADIADTIIYTIKVLNNGGDNATNVTATDILPNTLNLTSVTTTLGTYATSTGIWTIGNLTNGASTTMTITASVKAGTEGQKIVNTATVSANESDPNTGNNSSTIETSIKAKDNPPSNPPTNGGGGGGRSGGRRTPPVGEILGASTCAYLRDYLKIGWKNDPIEVLKVQVFLNVFEKENLSLTSVFDNSTYEAVSRFQNKYKSDILTPWGHTKPTGFVYILTKKKINEIYCNTLISLSDADQNEIIEFRKLLNNAISSYKTSNYVESKSTSYRSSIPQTIVKSGEVTGSSKTQNNVLESKVVELEKDNKKILSNAAVSLFAFPKIKNGVGCVSCCMDYRCLIMFLILFIILCLVAFLIGTLVKNVSKKRFIRSLVVAIGSLIIILISIILSIICLILPFVIVFAVAVLNWFLNPNKDDDSNLPPLPKEELPIGAGLVRDGEIVIDNSIVN